MIHEPAKWAGWQSTTAAAQHLDRLKQMQDQIYRILAVRSGKPLRQIIRDTKRTDFYLDAAHAKTYGLIDEVLGHSGRVSVLRERVVLRSTRSSRRASMLCRAADEAAHRTGRRQARPEDLTGSP